MLTTWGVRAPGLSDGQVVTLLVGVGLDLVDRHARGRPFGPVHPTHLRLDAHRRPRLVDVPATPGWTARDDWVSLLRLGRLLGRGAWAATLGWGGAGGREGRELLRWLLEQRDAEPLPVSPFLGLVPGHEFPTGRPARRRAGRRGRPRAPGGASGARR